MINLQQRLQQFALAEVLHNDRNVHLAPNIPASKLAGALSYLPSEVQAQDILILVDDTVFGSAKLGLVVTQEQLFYKAQMELVREWQLRNIGRLDMEQGWFNRSLRVNGLQKLELIQIENHTLAALLKLLQQHILDLHQDRYSQQEHQWQQHSTEQSHDEIQHACQLFGLSLAELNTATLQRAYQRKIAEFHPDKYQQLPLSVQQLIEQQAQQINQARAVLKQYLAHSRE
ncbi:hypothetical protein [Acinetobacter haemolyticus]|uniref:hypothetical protein n=1 Tax=Acinetobacter haemolyticus TaxID=29430 RepID=UPI001331C811|nr:hypothetical protein [Acinetobacter haemolyticus]NAS03704.1 hypothetical protein [Acinetobacter haemolyticus]NAS08449.1 hypothetical protein [Acinetobacter haemolyticus]QHI29953.1 hypothetical protein AhaeINNSZ174_10960 [Acinetobacter haemolyticus]QHI32303.1 hypothetical protein Ahae11616_06400 [Acinetobacter haemolyticus]